MQTNDLCLCGRNAPFSECCEPFISLKCKPSTAEQLMRSRYSAFATENRDYLLKTWHPKTRPNTLHFDSGAKWLSLKVKRTKAGASSDDYGWVEFVARYKIAGKAERIEELSSFIKEQEQWFYVAHENKNWDELS